MKKVKEWKLSLVNVWTLGVALYTFLNLSLFVVAFSHIISTGKNANINIDNGPCECQDLIPLQ